MTHCKRDTFGLLMNQGHLSIERHKDVCCLEVLVVYTEHRPVLSEHEFGESSASSSEGDKGVLYRDTVLRLNKCHHTVTRQLDLVPRLFTSGGARLGVGQTLYLHVD